jgi:hypothetical protein
MSDEKPSRSQRLLNGLNRAYRTYAWLVWFIFYRIPTAAAEFVGVAFATVVLRDYAKDTTTISNAAFVVVAALATLSFGCARAIADQDADRERFLFAGECMFEGAVLLMVASFLKYAILQFQASPLSSGAVWSWFGPCAGFVVGVLFFRAVFRAGPGLRMITDVLCERSGRHPLWGSWLDRRWMGP